ncbi:GntR family transcriptional regulator [Companilactobacillus kimchiensis]|uniref:HTH gntR-type domain-containing protein n=1 Tax=Companilactobacillus kimchiensis TaxID=993692 RepID=A0A0R2LP49_9LACO|nr:GntR family transcriptional regulator [Companilactobacillus kimchiensis]KRO00877.1 hypothetical protein IV57_GL000198 [Companilactobacillus kimchiensis]
MNKDIPLYLQIKNNLRFKINSGEWIDGDKIPSEMELGETFNVSRITIRHALDELVQEGYLIRQRPKGTFVREPQDLKQKSSYTLVTSFTQEMQELGKKPTTIWAHVKKISANELFARRLNVDVGTPLLSLKRLRGADDEIITYSETYTPYHKGFSLNSSDYKGSLYEYLAKFDIHVNQQTEYVEAVDATPKLMELLNMKKKEPLLKRVREISELDSDYYEYSINYYIGTKYRFYVKY